jgi:putative hydrolase of the HAD superfamily
MIVARGASPEPFESALKSLLALNEVSVNSKEAIRDTLESYGAMHLFEEALTLYTEPLPPGFAVQTTPNAKNVLHALREKGHRLAIVTGGKNAFQLDKIEKAGFELSVFSKIMVSENCIKKPYYEALLKEFSELPSDCVVIGDRIPMDLLPAHELGFRTVHMRWGRGRMWKSENWIDHSIRELSELLEILV